MNTPTTHPIGSEAFWVLYDKFCTVEELKKLSAGEQTTLCLELQQILREGHDHIVNLNRSTRGWENPKAWLALRHETVLDTRGNVFLHIQAGDVMTREFGWDRDVFVTHSPIIEMVSGQFLGQRWMGAQKGLFLPLFDRDTIMCAIMSKLKRNFVQSLEKAKQEARDWQWY